MGNRLQIRRVDDLRARNETRPWVRCLLAVIVALLVPGASAVAESVIWPIAKLSPARDVELRCTGASQSVQLPIPERWDIRKAVLRFSYTNSTALLKANSQILVKLNESPLAQVKLDPLAPGGLMEVPLPPALLTAGYNTIEFRIAQHYSLGCEAPCAPELWTHLKLGEATIQLDYDLAPVPRQLSALPGFLFDPKIAPDGRVHLVHEGFIPQSLNLAAVAASGIALRFDYRRVRFSSAEDLRPGVDNVVVGGKSFVEALLKRYGVDLDIQGPMIAIFHLPVMKQITSPGATAPVESSSRTDERYALLVITGRNPEEAKIAAESFDVISTPFPDSDRMLIAEFNLPQIRLYSGKHMLVPGEKYPLKKLNFRTHNFHGFNSTTRDVTFRLPPDFLIKPNQQVDLSLDFSYGAGMRRDSVINVLLNDEFVQAVQLDSEHGGMITGYAIGLPTFLFRSGANTLTFKAALAPLISEHCSFVQTENLQLTLYDSSSLFFPEMPHRIDMPRMELFFINGFPFTRWPDGYESTLLVTKASRATTDAMLNLVALISQKNGYPLFGMEVITEAPEKMENELLVVGPLDSVPEKILKSAPLVLGEFNRVPYSVFQSWEDRSALAFSEQKSGVGSHKGIVMQFQSPYREGRTAMLFSATSDEGLDRLVEALFEPKLQAEAKGDLMFVDFADAGGDPTRALAAEDFQISVMQTGKSYVTGKGGQISKADFYLSSYPWVYWLAVAAVILLLSWVVYALMRHQLRRRLGND